MKIKTDPKEQLREDRIIAETKRIQEGLKETKRKQQSIPTLKVFKYERLTKPINIKGLRLSINRSRTMIQKLTRRQEINDKKYQQQTNRITNKIAILRNEIECKNQMINNIKEKKDLL